MKTLKDRVPCPFLVQRYLNTHKGIITLRPASPTLPGLVVARVALTECHRPQGINRVYLFPVLGPEVEQKNASRVLQLSLLRRLPVSSSQSPSVPVSRFPLCVRTPVILVTLGPTSMTSFNSNHLFKGPISKYSHVGLGLKHVNLGVG